MQQQSQRAARMFLLTLVSVLCYSSSFVVVKGFGQQHQHQRQPQPQQRFIGTSGIGQRAPSHSNNCVNARLLSSIYGTTSIVARRTDTALSSAAAADVTGKRFGFEVRQAKREANRQRRRQRGDKRDDASNSSAVVDNDDLSNISNSNGNNGNPSIIAVLARSMKMIFAKLFGFIFVGRS